MFHFPIHKCQISEIMSVKPLYDRSLLVSSKRDIRTDLALKFAKQELAGESNLAQRPSSAGGISSRPLAPACIEEILALQAKGFSPIIVVPSVSSSRSRLTALNALRFLKDGIYEEPNTRTMTRPETPLEIERIIGGKNLKFRIIDETAKFRKDDWKSIVAVFTEGKLWQFAGWPFRSESDLFQSIQAFNLRYSDDQVEPLVASGRIKSLIIKRSARHQDSAIMIEFWKTLESYLLQPRVRRFSNSQKL